MSKKKQYLTVEEWARVNAAVLRDREWIESAGPSNMDLARRYSDELGKREPLNADRLPGILEAHGIVRPGAPEGGALAQRIGALERRLALVEQALAERLSAEGVKQKALWPGASPGPGKEGAANGQQR